MIQPGDKTTGPTSTITMWWCPVCDYFAGYNKFRHYAGGRICRGEATSILYVRESGDFDGRRPDPDSGSSA